MSLLSTVGTASDDRPQPPMRLNIVILFLGSRGDLQPSLAVAKLLQRRYGHRVRIASHPPYQSSVEAAGVDFYGIGQCDIKTMMERRLLPRDELKKAVPLIREEFREMSERWWGACVDAPAGEDGGGGFVADVVLSTMQVFNHTSAAARLGVPLHLFGMNQRVYSREIPHSQAGWAAEGLSTWKNAVSWWVQDFMFLQTMKSVINEVRTAGMGLEAMSPAWWLSQYNRMGVPCTYLWSPELLPKPSDWPDNVNVAGFVFDEVPEGYVPPADLVAFLEAEETPPVYIGFGSMSFADAQGVFENIFEAVREVGVRAVVCKGWSNLVKDGTKSNPDKGAGSRDMSHVLIIDDAPHAWLFPRVRAVVCHGGSGTTAMALRSGRPTLVVPVAGDQPFWATRVAKVDCGPEGGFGVAELTKDGFRDNLVELLKLEFAEGARRFGERIRAERPGEEVFAEAVLESARVYERGGRCEVFAERPAVWRTGDGRMLSAVAAAVLVRERRLSQGALRPAEIVKWPDLTSPGDPVTGLVLGVQGVVSGVAGDVKGGHWGLLPLHVLRGPLTILAAVFFGMFNLVDFILYKLASPFTPKLYASNPRLYTYPQMLRFLLSAPLVELGSVVAQPAVLARRGRGVVRVSLEVPLALMRTLVALLNVLVGFLGITLRHAEIACAGGMGERPREDVVASARIRQGRMEAEILAIERAETGEGFAKEIVREWDAKKTV